MVLLDAEEARLVLLRDNATVEGHERFHGLALDVAEHHGEAEPETTREARLLEADVRRRVNPRERVVLLEEKSDRRKHGDATVLDFGLAVESQAAGVHIFRQSERVEEAEGRGRAGPLGDGRGGELRLRGRSRRGRDEGGGGAGGESEGELHD